VNRNSAPVTVLRWLLFLPAAFVASVIGGFLGTLGGARFSEFIGFTTSGAFSAFAFVMTGMTVAPKRTRTVKWVLIIISALLGIVSAVGSWLGEDRLKMAIGISMVLSSFIFAAVPHDEVVRPSPSTAMDDAL
jgi:hypothetical protein